MNELGLIVSEGGGETIHEGVGEKVKEHGRNEGVGEKVNGHGRKWTNLDELGRTWTNMDEHGRTVSEGRTERYDEHGRTWTNRI